MGFAPVALGVASLLASVGGTVMQAQAQSQSAAYNAQVARNNQTIANQNAGLALEQGQQAEETQKIKTGEMISGIEAGQAASGVNPNEGSPLNVRISAAETGDLDAETIRYNANLQAQNLQYQGSMYGSQAQLDQSQGQYGVAASILGGASSVSSKWLQYNQSGVFGAGGGTSYIGSYGNY